ncbi:hypothetical protein BSAF29S_03215 [Bacillus safensis subsp. safensis]
MNKLEKTFPKGFYGAALLQPTKLKAHIIKMEKAYRQLMYHQMVLCTHSMNQ